MRIVHFAPFAPHQAGLYETTRDMIKAERLAGHVSELIDTGYPGQKRRLHVKDSRNECSIIARSDDEVKDFDIIVSNNNIPNSFLAKTVMPAVQIMHGRPESSFRLSQREPKSPVYDIYSSMVANERVKLFISLWPEHIPYWQVVIPEKKLRTVQLPPCDLEQFTFEGPVHKFEPKGRLNILIADIWRADTDPYHVAHALIEASKATKGIKVHFYGCNTKPGPWAYIFKHMKRIGILGETKGMMHNIDQVYRAADAVVTPHWIATRIIRESLACGTPVIGPMENHDAQFSVPIREPEKAGRQLALIFGQIAGNQKESRAAALDMAQKYNLKDFGRRICALYEEALNGTGQCPAAMLVSFNRAN